MVIDLPDLFTATKTLSDLHAGWVERDSDNLVFVSPLDIDAVTVQGLRLRITARSSLPDEAVTAQIEYHGLRGRYGPLCRLEWRPITGHSNKGIGPPEFRHRLLTGSHHHSFGLNWQYAASAVRRGNLPVAVPVNPDPPDYRAALALAATEFRIGDLGSIPVPPWQPKIL